MHRLPRPKSMQIRIRYQRRDETTPRVLELSPEDYFDPLEPGETLSVRSVPRLLETYQYTPHSAGELAWTVVEITAGKASWRVRTQLLDGLHTFMHHSQETGGSEEIIHQTEIRPGCWHIVRTLKLPGKEWAVVLNSLTVEQPGEPAASTDFCEQWSFEELKAFGEVE